MDEYPKFPNRTDKKFSSEHHTNTVTHDATKNSVDLTSSWDLASPLALHDDIYVRNFYFRSAHSDTSLKLMSQFARTSSFLQQFTSM